MNCIFLNHSQIPMTGGQKYNNALLSYLKSNFGAIVNTTPHCSDVYSGWRKVFAPFSELKWIKNIDESTIVFFGDTCFRYHLLLLLLLRLLNKGIPVVIVHHFPYLNDRGLVRYFNFVWQYVYYGLCRLIIVPSPFTRKIAESLFNVNRVVNIPLPLSNYYHISNEFEVGRLLFVGTVERRKGLNFLIDALIVICHRNPGLNIHLDVVGQIRDPHFHMLLLKKASENGVSEKIKYWGRVSDEQLEILYKKAEIFTFPSLLEGYGIVLIEAMNHGLPVVAFNNTAIPFTIQDGVSGLLASNKDFSSFADKVLQLSGNNVLRKKLQKGMRDKIRNVSTQRDFEIGVESLVEIIENIIGFKTFAKN